jgi:aspartate ammonia-lyase
MRMRLERNSLGQHKVPFNARFAIYSQRAIDNCRISGYRAHLLINLVTGMIKKAGVVVNYELRLIDEKYANVIRRSAEEVIEGKWNAEFLVDVYRVGAGVSSP